MRAGPFGSGAMTTEEHLERGAPERAPVKGPNRAVTVVRVVLWALAATFFLGMVVNKVWVPAIGIPMVIAVVGAILLTWPTRVLGWVPVRARLMTVGILLLGITAAIAAWATVTGLFLFRRSGSAAEVAALCGFVIATTGLSGLVCAVLGFARLMGKRKGI